jgi:NADPH:quinone reductase-like Zn-dependent oxidoreductase
VLGTTMGSPADFAGMCQLVDAGKITPVVDKVYALDAADGALRHMEAGTQFGKIVLTC